MSFSLANSSVFSRSVSFPSPLPVRRRQKRNGTRRGDEGEGEEEEEEPRQAISNSGRKKEGEEEEESFGMTQNGGRGAREGLMNTRLLVCILRQKKKERRCGMGGGILSLFLLVCTLSLSFHFCQPEE